MTSRDRTSRRRLPRARTFFDVRRRRALSADDGFTIVEVTVAMVIFALIAASVIGLVIQSLATSTDSRRRVAATSLAAREIDIVRGQFMSAAVDQGPQSVALGRVVNSNPLAGGTVGAPLVLDGTAYTVTRTAQWQSQGATASACDGGASGQLAYLRVSVSVTWPKMRSVRPVISNTLLTPRIGTFDSATGHVPVKLIDAAGNPTAGQVVTLTGPSGTATQTTSADGCAFFGFLTPGSYTASVSASGYVDNNWNPTATGTRTVTAGAVAQTLTFAYAPATTLTTTATVRTGYSVPAGLGYTAYNTGLSTAYRTKILGTRGASSTDMIWPYTDGITTWAGTCLDADPQAYSSTGRGSPVATTPGGTASAAPALQPVDVRVTKTGVAVANAQVYAVHATDAACAGPVTDPTGGTAGDALTLPKTDATGTSKVGIPLGRWTFKVRYQPGGPSTAATYTYAMPSALAPVGTGTPPVYTVAIP